MKRLTFVLCVVAMLGLMNRPAEAAFQITFTSGVNTLTVSDNGTGDANSANYIIDVDGDPFTLGTQPLSFAGYTLSGTNGQDFNSVIDPNAPGLGLTNLAITNVSATNPLTITISATDYTFPSGTGQIISSASLSTTTGSGTYAWQSFYCSSNALNCTSGAGSQSAPQINLLWNSSVHAASGQSLSGFFALTTPYSLTSVATITIATNNTAVLTTGNERVVAPEPSSLLLLGTGLFGVGGFLRRRRNARS